MFRYDFKKKNENIKKLVGLIRKTYNIEVPTSEAGKLAYLIGQRQFMVDSLEIVGLDIQTGIERFVLLKVADLRYQLQFN